MFRALIAATVVTLAATTGASRAGMAVPRTGEEVVAALQKGRVSMSGATIEGDVDFRPFDVVARPFSCRNCTFTGRILATDVVFGATIDLSGAQLMRPIVMRRTTFRAPLLFGPTTGDPGSTTFADVADFTLARFGDLVTFAAASFKRNADFTSARFDGESVFADATFRRRAMFERAFFRAGADFRQSRFSGQATFTASQFDRGVDFSQSGFAARAGFDQTRFGREATFLGTFFKHPGRGSFGVTFASATAQDDLVFDRATFAGRTNFRRAVAGDALSFDDAILGDGSYFVFTSASAERFSLDVDAALTHVQRTDRARVLRLIEAGAKARGDLGVANDARYSLEVLESRDEPWHRRAANVVFYRLIAGYFVRPLHPIAALLVLVSVISLARVLTSGARLSGFFRRAWVGMRRFAHEFLDALALVGPGGDATDRQGRRLEAIAYRVLVVCALIGLANSNPTLREMFDALV